MGSSTSSPILSKSDKVWSSFRGLQANGLSRLINKWHSSELDALDSRLMEVCKYQKKKYLNFPLFLQFFPKLRKLRQSVQRMYFDFFDVTGSTFIAPKQLVACLSVIMFIEKARFGKVVLAKVFRHNNADYLTQQELHHFESLNKNFLLTDAQLKTKAVTKDKATRDNKKKTISLDDFSQLVATQYNVIEYVRLFDFYDTDYEQEVVQKLRREGDEKDEHKGEVSISDNSLRKSNTSTTENKLFVLKLHINKGDIVYLISMEWFLVWVKYMQIHDCNEISFKINTQTEEEKRFSEDSLSQQANQHWITRPPKINNLPLLSEYEEDIKPGMHFFVDVVPLCQPLWKMFQRVYGGGPQIRRVYPELYPMIIYRLYLENNLDFKYEFKRKMHLEKAPIEKVLDANERPKIDQVSTHTMYFRKVYDQQWTQLKQMSQVLWNRNINHGYFVYVSNSIAQQFEKRYIDQGHELRNLHFGRPCQIRSILGDVQKCYVNSMSDNYIGFHYPGNSYTCDVEYSIDELIKTFEDELYTPIPRVMYYGLPSLKTKNDEAHTYIVPVLECLLCTPYFKWYLERKKFSDALAREYTTNSIVKQLSELAEVYKRKKSKEEGKKELQRFCKMFFERYPAYRQKIAHDTIFPNEFLDDLLKVMAEELSIPEYVLEATNINYAREQPSQNDECFSIIPKFFSQLEQQKKMCQECKCQEVTRDNIYVLSLPVCEDSLKFYKATFRSLKGQFKRFAIKIKRSEKFEDYARRFSQKIGIIVDRLAIAEVSNNEFRKHYGSNDYESSLQLLGLRENDDIFIFEMPDDAGTELRGSQKRVLSSFMSFSPGSLVDFNVYSDWQVGMVIKSDREKATIQSHDGPTEVEHRRIRLFKEKTREKPLFRIDVLHRKWSNERYKIEYFLIPSVISVGQWMKWDEVEPLILKEAERFTKFIVTNVNLPTVAKQSRSPMTGSRVREDYLQSNRHLQNPESATIGSNTNIRQIQDTQQPLYKIHIMQKNAGEICAKCQQKIQIKTQQNSITQEKYCQGCKIPREEPIGVSIDLRKVCFTVDWTVDFTYRLPDSIEKDESYDYEYRQIEESKNDIEESLKTYSESGVKDDRFICSRCKYSQGIIKRNLEKIPNILCIHMTRFKKVKDIYVTFDNKINFPERLSLSGIILGGDPGNESYQLYGMIGLRNLDLNPRAKEWYSIFMKNKGLYLYSKDEVATPIDYSKIKSQEIYMLFYRKVNVQGTLITNVI